MSVQVSLVENAGSQTTKAEARVEEIVGDGYDVTKFVENFEVMAEAEGGLKRLRELAIELAVRGLLLEGADPSSWKRVLLSDVAADFQNGISKRTGDAGRAMPVLRLADIDRGSRIRGEGLREIALTANEEEKYRVARGDILVIRVNGSADLVGRFVPCDVSREWAYSDHLIRVRPHATLVDTGFLCSVARSAASRAHVASNTVTTAGQRTINQVGLGSLPLLLPPLAEQRRIVARVDQLMALIDDLEARQTKKRELSARFTKASLAALTTAEGPAEFDTAWKRVVENFPTVIDRAEKVAELRRTALELAMRGMLVPEVAADEPVEQQLRRIRDERMRQGRNPPEVPIDEACVYRIPGHWRWVRWADLVIETNSGWSPQCESRPRADGEWGVLKVSAVSWLTFNGGENKALPKGVQPRVECATRLGDFLMSRANTAELVGRSVIVDAEPERLLLSDKIVRCVFSKEVDQRYINLFNRTTAARTHYVANASGTSDSMKNISREVILAMRVALPPLEEQKRIVARVEQLMKLCDDLETKLCRAENRASKLVEAVVREMVP